ncbi:MAG: cellulase family glycosylhydrolase [Chthonomonadales bacterium]
MIGLIAALLAISPAQQPGLTVARGVLMKDGTPFRGIGVNYFNAFMRTLTDAEDHTYDAGFGQLQAHGIPFARFMCCGFWPADMRLYRTDRAEYFRRLDRVIQSAQRHHVGLIPDLFWNLATVPDLVGEPCNQWGNPKSKTRAFMRTYVREVVTRYLRSPAIWGWEFGNEYNLAADLPNAAQHRPPVAPQYGTPSSRTEQDEISHEVFRSALAAFAREVRRYDTRRIIVSGNAFPRPSAWHQMHEHSWTPDNAAQRDQMLAQDNPDPINTLCVHAYEDYNRIPEAAALARKLGKPLFVGEFGVPGPPSPEARRKFSDMLKVLRQEGVPLAALWVFDYAPQDEWNVTAASDRAWQLREIEEANKSMHATPIRGTR